MKETSALPAGPAAPRPANAPRVGLRVGLFVTCVVDLMRPSVAVAAVKLLEDAGCTVIVPPQTCCGQPAYNAGDRKTARTIAEQTIEAFGACDYVAAPGGSCAGMLAVHYPELFKGEPEWAAKAEAFAAKTHELVSFLVDVLGVERVSARCEGTATYHDSCAGLRELGVKAQPRKLLASVEGLKLIEMAEPETCCGFGGMFAVKYGELSGEIVARKCADIDRTGAGMVIAGDVGCLMNMGGKLQRAGSATKARHIAEVLAGMADEPAIGEPRGRPSR